MGDFFIRHLSLFLPQMLVKVQSKVSQLVQSKLYLFLDVLVNYAAYQVTKKSPNHEKQLFPCICRLSQDQLIQDVWNWKRFSKTLLSGLSFLLLVGSVPTCKYFFSGLQAEREAAVILGDSSGESRGEAERAQCPSAFQASACIVSAD